MSTLQQMCSSGLYSVKVPLQYALRLECEQNFVPFHHYRHISVFLTYTTASNRCVLCPFGYFSTYLMLLVLWTADDKRKPNDYWCAAMCREEAGYIHVMVTIITTFQEQKLWVTVLYGQSHDKRRGFFEVVWWVKIALWLTQCWISNLQV